MGRNNFVFDHRTLKPKKALKTLKKKLKPKNIFPKKPKFFPAMQESATLQI